MSVPTVPIPAFRHSCLGPGWNPLTLYLIGNSDRGNLTVHAINLSNVNSPTATFLSRLANDDRALPTSMKCVFFPFDTIQNSPIMVESFQNVAPVIPVYPNATFGVPWIWSSVTFMDARTYSTIGAVYNQTAIIGWATVRKPAPGSPADSPLVETQQWALSRQSWETSDILREVVNISPSQPMLTAGVYFSSSPDGALIVFDQQSNGVIYQTTAFTSSPIAGKPFTLQWGITGQQQIDLGGVVISSDAISVDGLDVAYILDKTADGLTAVYVIRPKASNKLEKISKLGDAPPFSRDMTAMIWKGPSSLIATYYLNTTTNTPYFNLFSPVLGTWTGLGLVSPPPPTTTTTSGNNPSQFPNSNTKDSLDSKGSNTPIGGIVGGVVGGLVVIALVVFMFVRQRKGQPVFSKHKDSSNENKERNSKMKKSQGDETGDMARLATVHGIDKPYTPHGYDNGSTNDSSIELRESKRGDPQSLNSSGLWDNPVRISHIGPNMFGSPTTTPTAFTKTNNDYQYSPPTIPLIFQPQQGYTQPAAIVVSDHNYQPIPPQGPQFVDPFQKQLLNNPPIEPPLPEFGGSVTQSPHAIIPELNGSQHLHSTPSSPHSNSTIVPITQFYNPPSLFAHSAPVPITSPNAGASSPHVHCPSSLQAQSAPVTFLSPNNLTSP
ncbi:hypothetical protein FBU30_000504 [Linnemannia zychae]|nr:hypothetical protein FBU30_000504 [Linnemannia zychae]